MIARRMRLAIAHMGFGVQRDNALATSVDGAMNHHETQSEMRHQIQKALAPKPSSCSCSSISAAVVNTCSTKLRYVYAPDATTSR